MQNCLIPHNPHFKRDDKFHYIIQDQLPLDQLDWAKKLVNDVSKAEKVDEHGGWDFGIEGDSAVWAALNWDMFGLGTDIHAGNSLAAIQVRQSYKPHKNYGFPNVRKSYFLAGYNEDETAFAHAVSSQVVHYAIREDLDVILRCQNWIFGGDYAKMQRQGDIAVFPGRRSGKDTGKTEMRLQDSHRLYADKIYSNGSLFARNPTLEHEPEVHPIIQARGWHKIIQARRGRIYDFAMPTLD